MGNIVFKVNEEYCKGCGLCVSVCPKKILELSLDKTNSKGYNAMRIIDEDKCIGCLCCARICPDVVMQIERKDGKEETVS